MSGSVGTGGYRRRGRGGTVRRPRRAAAAAPEGAGPRSNPANLESRAAARRLLSSLTCRVSAWLSIFHSATSRCPATLHEKARSSCNVASCSWLISGRSACGSPSRYRWLATCCGRRPPRGRDYSDGIVVYSGARMKLSFVRLVATLLLSGQMLPVGLPLLCDQVQRGTPASCEQQISSHRSGPAVGATTHATPCANPAFCAITAPAVVTLGGAVSTSARESHIVGFGVSTLAPADPQAPLPPPPQA